MTIAQALASLTHDDLKVEAGATVESAIAVFHAGRAGGDEFEEYSLRVRGLPERWFTLGTAKLRLLAGERVEVLLVIHPPHDDPAAPLGEYLFAVELSPSPVGEIISLPGRLLVLAPGGTSLESRLLEYLPSLYRSDPFLARFLLIFQSILDPIEQTIDNTHHYLDPGLTPAEFLPWLVSWLGMNFNPGLDEAGQRELVRRGVDLCRWRGTRRGLRDELNIRTGGRALIVENFDGMRLGQDACLGLNTQLGARRDHCIAVTLATDKVTVVDQQQAETLVAELKPAHVGHVVRVVSAPGSELGGNHG